jgi:hypothetical protein
LVVFTSTKLCLSIYFEVFVYAGSIMKLMNINTFDKI